MIKPKFSGVWQHAMLARRPLRCRCVAVAAPPGIGRLALSPKDHSDLERLACRDGPSRALEFCVARGDLDSDLSQVECAEQLQQLRDVAYTYAQDMLEWRRCDSIWRSSFRQALREVREKEKKEDQSNAKKARRNAPTADHAERHESETDAPPRKQRARLERLAREDPRPPRPVPVSQGLFLWGGVGRGKSLLMDLFVLSFSAASDTGPFLRRQHYHDFMTDVHRRLQRKPGAAKRTSVHAVKAAANELSSQCPTVLCLDELQVTNIAEAVVLRDLFKQMFANGTFLVTTCNRPPEDLYKDGLNYMTYMPQFLQLLRERIGVHHLDSLVDYRIKKCEEEASGSRVAGVSQSDFFVAPTGCHDLDASFAEAASQGKSPENLPADATSQDLFVSWGRRLKCQKVHPAGVARFTFQEICGAPLGADDYSALIDKNSLHTFVVSDIPKFTLTQHNEARRFTNFVDCLYEGNCRLICTAAASPEDIMTEMASLSDVALEQPASAVDAATLPRTTRRHGDVNFETSALSPCRPDTFATAEADAESGTGDADILQAVLAARKRGQQSGNSVDPTEQDGVAGVASAAIVSLQESGFAARRCVSRLREMSTDAYLQAHRTSWALTP